MDKMTQWRIESVSSW